MLALIQAAADPAHTAAWWLAALWLFRCLCLWSFFWGGCPCCGIVCTLCDGNAAPNEYQLVVPTLTNGGCSNCADYDGTFVLTAAQPIPPFLNGCAWTFNIASPTCNFTGGDCTAAAPGCEINTITFGFFQAGPNTNAQLRFYDRNKLDIGGDFAASNLWNNNYGATPPDCDGFVDEEIGTLNSNNNTTGCLNGSNPTITAL